MTANLTDTDTFTNPIVAPADGDPGNGTTFQVGLQGLANRTRNLLNTRAKVEVFTANGTYTRPTGATGARFVLVGGGGGGAGSNASSGGGGGGGGECREFFMPLSALPASLAVTVGQGGPGGATTVFGTDGTASTVVGGSISVSAAGGLRGQGASGFVGGNGGGYYDNGTTKLYGKGGESGSSNGAPGLERIGGGGGYGNNSGAGGNGGARLIAGGTGGAAATNPGNGAVGYGGGGGGGGGSAGGGGGGGASSGIPGANGANGSGTSGGAGANGIVIITTFFG